MGATLLRLFDVHFVPNGTGAKILVASLSPHRMRLIRSTELSSPGLNKTLEGVLVFNWDRHPVSAREELESVAAVDFVLEGSRSGLSESLTRLYEGSALVASLYETPPELLQVDPVGESHLFRGDRGLELTLLFGPKGEILRFTASLENHYVEGGRGLPTSRGFVSADIPAGMPGYKGSALIGRSEGKQAEVIEALAELASVMPHLELPQRTELSGLIRLAAAD